MKSASFTRRAALGSAGAALVAMPMLTNAQSSPEASPSGETRIVTDYLDRDIEVPVHPQRVITLSLPILEIALSVGITPVGSASFATLTGFPDAIAERAEGIELVGDKEWDFEKIITLEPDLAIVDYFGDQDAEALAILEEIVPVITVGQFRENWREDSANVAIALNEEDAFDEIEQQYDDRVAELNELLADEWSGKTVAVLRFRAGDIRILKSNSFAGTVLADLNLTFPEDIADSGSGIAEDFSVEQAQMVDVDALFVVHDSGTEAEENFSSVLESPLFQLLDVVQRGNVYQVEQEVWITLRGYGATSIIFDDIERYLVNGEPGFQSES